MSKVRAFPTVSLDGFMAGPNQSEENPLGEGGEELHEWMLRLKVWREAHGYEGGASGESSQVAEEMTANVGAGIMGRKMFGPIGGGDWGDGAWKGWWGEDPPFHTPVFVVTHHPREPLEMEGGTTFHFVTDGIESALAQAREAAAGKDVAVHGGASTIRQLLAAGHLDELVLNIAPILLGSGERPLDELGPNPPRLELERTIAAPNVTHLKYRVG
jgi:dihydrofolate reductase